METTNTRPKSFMVIAILALLWNIIGVLSYLGSVYMTEETFNELPQGQQDFLNNAPSWVTAAYAIAVFSGFIASIGLLMKKKWCVPLFIMSFLAILANDIYSYGMTNGYEAFGGAPGMVVPVLVFVFGLFLIFYSRKARAHGWIS